MDKKLNGINSDVIESFLNEEMDEVKGGATEGPVCHCTSGAAAVIVADPTDGSGMRGA